MFSKTVIDSDAFLDLPHDSQLLYFHLSMRADDDGFVNNPRTVMRGLGCGEAEFRLLAERRFIIEFESGVIAIRHWRVHNLVRNDRYRPTVCAREKRLLYITEQGTYTLSRDEAHALLPSSESGGKPILLCDLNGEKKRLTEVSIGEGSVGKDSIGEVRSFTTTTDDAGECAPCLSEVYDYFRSNFDGDCVNEAEKFHSYNENRGWICPSGWRTAANLWISRIKDFDERRVLRKGK